MINFNNILINEITGKLVSTGFNGKDYFPQAIYGEYL